MCFTRMTTSSPHNYHSHFTSEGTEVQRGYATCPRSHSQQMADLVSNTGSLTPNSTGPYKSILLKKKITHGTCLRTVGRTLLKTIVAG